jgi:hypothetical protein
MSVMLNTAIIIINVLVLGLIISRIISHVNNDFAVYTGNA